MKENVCSVAIVLQTTFENVCLYFIMFVFVTGLFTNMNKMNKNFAHYDV